jgi:uncharacterized protein (TIGR01777 family)
MRVLMTGASGFVGRALTKALLARGDRVVALSRSGRGPDGAQSMAADPTEPGGWLTEVAACDAVVHLAGEPIDAHRWSEVHRQRVHDSRVASARLIAAAGPRVLVCASGADYYPWDESDHEYDEDEEPGDSFLAHVCRDWEAAARDSKGRVTCVRSGLVLGRGGGVLSKMATAFRLFLGGPVGSGRQWFPWIHIDDIIGAYLLAIDRADAPPTLNGVAPESVRQGDFARALGRALGRPSWLPVPAPMLRLAVGELADYLLNGRRVVPRSLAAAGYSFQHGTVDDALRACISSS